MTEWTPPATLDELAEARRRSWAIRKQWAEDIGTGKRTIHEALVQPGKEGKYIRRTSLAKILAHAEGWNADKPTAIRRALVDNGFADNKACLGDLNSQAKIRTFEGLLHSTSERWTPRVNFPEKWPFMGKLEEVLGQPSVLPFLPEDMRHTEGDAEDMSEQGFHEATDLEMGSILPGADDYRKKRESEGEDSLDALMDDWFGDEEEDEEGEGEDE